MRRGPKASVSKKTGGRASTVGAHAKPSLAMKRRSVNRERMLVEVEDKIDWLIFGLLEIGGVEKAQDAHRAARRVVVRAQKA
jgi:hypothetical protein